MADRKLGKVTETQRPRRKKGTEKWEVLKGKGMR
jgi:hypothetical protein